MDHSWKKIQVGHKTIYNKNNKLQELKKNLKRENILPMFQYI